MCNFFIIIFFEATVRAELGVKIIVWLWLKKGCRHLFYDPDGFLAKTPRVPARCFGFGWRLAGLAGLAALGG